MGAVGDARGASLERHRSLNERGGDRDLGWRRAWSALYIATISVYAIALGSPFQFDDRAIAGAGLGGLRPVVKLSYALCGLGGGGPVAFHVFNLVVHLLNVELVRRLTMRASGNRVAAFAAATLFALHPIHTEAVTYISGRSSLMATSFMMLALLAQARGGRLLRWGAVPLAFVLAVLSKETAFVLPLGLFVWDVTIIRAKCLLKRQAPWWGAALALFVFTLWHERYFTLLYRVVGQRALRDALVYQLAGLSYMTRRVLLLARPCIDPGLWEPPSTAAVTAGALIVALLASVALTQRRTRPVVCFGVTWFLVHALLPYLLVSRVDVINERHLYVADVGLFMAAGALWAEWLPSRRAIPRHALAVGVVASLCVFTCARNSEYSSELTLWQATVREAPKNPRALNNLGIAYEHANNLEAAHSAYARAIRTDPRYLPAHEGLQRVTANLRPHHPAPPRPPKSNQPW